jgi:hypothetical protein
MEDGLSSTVYCLDYGKIDPRLESVLHTTVEEDVATIGVESERYPFESRSLMSSSAAQSTHRK